MIYVLMSSTSVTVASDITRAVSQCVDGDVIITETIPIYNTVLQRLAATKPDTMIYVRMVGGQYFPAVGIEAYYGPDTDPILYPVGDIPNGDDTNNGGLA